MKKHKNPSPQMRKLWHKTVGRATLFKVQNEIHISAVIPSGN